MYCTNCGRKLVKNFCIHCGLMTNGVYVNTKKTAEEQDIEIYLGKDYDRIVRNKNWIESGIFGPVYILARGNILAGLMLTTLDMLITIFFLVFNHAFLLIQIVLLFNFIYLIINRMIWATIGNIIYEKLINKKIRDMKQGISYRIDEEIKKQYKRDTFLLGFKYIVLSVIAIYLFMILYRYTYDLFGFISVLSIKQ